MSRQNETLASIGSISGPVELKPLSNDHPRIHMVEDVKVIYQAIGKAAGFNVLFDPDYTSKRIPVDLTNVSWSDALRIVGTLAGTFYKPVTSNTIFVAQNTRTKRTDLDEQAVQTFYLTNASQQNDANEVVVAIRNLLDPSVKIYLVPSQNAIVMRATPDELLLAQKLLNDLDRARPEVVVDVAVLEVNRERSATLASPCRSPSRITPQATPDTHDHQQQHADHRHHRHHALQLHPQHPRPPQRQQLRRQHRRRHRQRAPHRRRHPHPAEPQHPRHRRPARDHEDRLRRSPSPPAPTTPVSPPASPASASRPSSPTSTSASTST